MQLNKKNALMLCTLVYSMQSHAMMHLFRKFENIKASAISKNKAQNTASSQLLNRASIARASASHNTTQIKSIADLQKEAEINIYVGKCFLGQTKFVGAPTSLLMALNKLDEAQTNAINAYHQAREEKAPIEKRARLHRNVELLIRDEAERTEILDNLRWLQRDGAISYVQKFTPSIYKALPFLSCLIPLSAFPFNTIPLLVDAAALCLPSIGFLCKAINDKKTAHAYRIKHQGKNKFTLHRGII